MFCIEFLFFVASSFVYFTSLILILIFCIGILYSLVYFVFLNTKLVFLEISKNITEPKIFMI